MNHLNYDSEPAKLQVAIKQVFIHATLQIRIDGTDVIPFPMYEILDGKHSEDYIARVEPSNLGGLKLAKEFVKLCVS